MFWNSCEPIIGLPHIPFLGDWDSVVARRSYNGWTVRVPNPSWDWRFDLLWQKLRPTQPCVKRVPERFLGGKVAQVLTTHGHLAQWLWKSGALPLRPLCACTVCYWETLTFIIKVFNFYSWRFKVLTEWQNLRELCMWKFSSDIRS